MENWKEKNMKFWENCKKNFRAFIHESVIGYLENGYEKILDIKKHEMCVNVNKRSNKYKETAI